MLPKENTMENEAIRTEEYKGHKIKFFQDDNPESPREWDNLGKMVCFHRRYDLGDKHDLTVEDAKALTKRDDIISLPLFLLDHSGITMNTGGFRHCDPQGWDSGQVGFIYVDRDKVKEEYHVKQIRQGVRQKVYSVLQGEVEAYDKYLRGDVYGFVIEDADGEQLDSCWGYYDEIENTIKECQATIDAHVKEVNEKKHYPKVEVFATKGCAFRARIRESVEQPSYEVSIGGQEWGAGKGRNHETEIKEKADLIIGSLLGQYEAQFGEVCDTRDGGGGGKS